MSTPQDFIDIEAPTTLLGGLSPRQFMRRHWQKKPLLIRQAVPGVQSPISRADMFALATKDDVESRLIVRHMVAAAAAGVLAGKGKKAAKAEQAVKADKSPKANKAAKAVAKASTQATVAEPAWSLRHGPLDDVKALPPLKQPGWTLLVQGLDLHVPAARALLERFRFVPDARVDDLMISYATAGGGVGPHFDSYDVFLLQVHGTRRWRIGELRDERLEPDVPLKILSHFEAQEEYVLEPGDMLYLPPRWAHDGVAEGEDCMTCSIGFRTPGEHELVRDILVRLADGEDLEGMGKLYRDPAQTATGQPGALPEALVDFASAAVTRVLNDPHALRSVLGEWLSEPKSHVWFEAGEPLPGRVPVVLDAKTRLVYDERCVYANGESWRIGGKDARQLRQLADHRRLDAKAMKGISDGLLELLTQWAEDGWLHVDGA
jgi:50S ribosomal protein L16 3-hydroxylase